MTAVPSIDPTPRRSSWATSGEVVGFRVRPGPLVDPALSSRRAVAVTRLASQRAQGADPRGRADALARTGQQRTD